MGQYCVGMQCVCMHDESSHSYLIVCVSVDVHIKVIVTTKIDELIEMRSGHGLAQWVRCVAPVDGQNMPRHKHFGHCTRTHRRVALFLA